LASDRGGGPIAKDEAHEFFVRGSARPTRTRVAYDGVSGATLESADAAEILPREAAEYADLARRLEDLTATRSEAPLLVVSLGPGSALTILHSS
jgi:hypothetical protein